MTNQSLTVLIVGATGSVARHVVAASVRAGHRTRALARSRYRAAGLDRGAEIVIGDLTDASTLADAVADIDAVIFTHGDNSHGEAVNYGAVRNVLTALGGRPVRIALMTTLGVTVRQDSSEWKRRGERLVRASGNEYTVVRPGWFDYNDDDQLRIVMRQADDHLTGTPADGVIARHELARVLVSALTEPLAVNKTFVLVADRGDEQKSLTGVFETLMPDDAGALDGYGDRPNMPVDQEPQHIRDDLAHIRR
ncbi:SDR family NAD(P)-dependent oxidoreductase [Curtobacterium sp. MCPF17_003]|uniref:SDR family oxidoreductase n=1 Tax=Curtobacterium sp. MCPF17_003 TaxID=2175637 RepID=UPI000D919510|nr:SDR family oxidoreductase [Curtobacterium sp. MCPF17_003]PYY64534.1 SDR family NAD(P)-dependent oxidoreductase [Curtobacterium sp. MCPF17_003]